MHNLKDDELCKVSGGIEDNVLLTWKFTFQRYVSKKSETVQLSHQYRLSEINVVREYVKNDCKKSHFFFLALYYQDPTTGNWVEVATE